MAGYGGRRASTVGGKAFGAAMRTANAQDAPRGRPDLVLLGAVAALLVVGLNMVYSSSFVVAHNSPTMRSDTYFLTRQLLWAGLGAIGLLVAMRVDHNRWRPLAGPLLAITVLLLVAVLFPRLGRAAYGAQRWLELGPLPAIQPSEFAKLSLVLFYADWLARRRAKLGRLESGPLPFALVLLVVAGLIMAQPDFGSAFVVIVAAICLFFVAGAQIVHLVGGLIVGGIVLAFLASGVGYRAQRLAAFFHSGEDPLGIGWHATQASIALGSGGLFGLGLGASRQKFYYLYGAHTDSIYAVIGEELGLVGTLGVLGLFVLVAYRGYRIALDAPDTFGALLAAGVTSWLTFQAIVNIAVATSTVPFTGIPLPFVSFGGSSLVASMIGVGLVLGVSRRRLRQTGGQATDVEDGSPREQPRRTAASRECLPWSLSRSQEAPGGVQQGQSLRWRVWGVPRTAKAYLVPTWDSGGRESCVCS